MYDNQNTTNNVASVGQTVKKWSPLTMSKEDLSQKWDLSTIKQSKD